MVTSAADKDESRVAQVHGSTEGSAREIEEGLHAFETTDKDNPVYHSHIMYNYLISLLFCL